MVKIDLAKAFDRLEWHFVDATLARKGLHAHFINLIHACISSPTLSIIINGQAYARFKSSRGIRQGCPLSPYLFVLASLTSLTRSFTRSPVGRYLSWTKLPSDSFSYDCR